MPGGSRAFHDDMFCELSLLVVTLARFIGAIVTMGGLLLRHVCLLGLFAAVSAVSPVDAKTLCTLVVDAASEAVVTEEGQCRDRVTPASTFKLALSVMAFDAGFLKDDHHPVLDFKKGYADWGGEAWKQPTDATRWLKHSVVWFSQEIARSLGAQTMRNYATRFGYGNADFSGDPGKNNGLERAWIASSLQISPVEQVAFLRRLVRHDLPVSAHAIDMTVRSMEDIKIAGGWTVRGKTGMAYPRLGDGSFDRAHPWGWFVGWAQKGERTLVFARLVQDERKLAGSASGRARDALLGELPALAAAR